jgi:RNA polymerase sigma-70 factor (ECF subfamily)
MSQADSHVPLDDLLAHRDWVRALARRLVGDASRADDVEQEVWVTALRRPPRHARSLRAWFGRLVRSRAHDSRRGETRRERRENETPPAPPPPGAEEVVARLEAHRKLVAVLDVLKEPYRSTLLLRYYEDLPPREVAARLGVPVETVRTRLKRAHEMLRRRLDDDHRGDRRAWIACLAPLTGSPAEPRPVDLPAGAPRPASPGTLMAMGVLVAAVVGIALLSSSTPDLPSVPEGPAASVPEDRVSGTSVTRAATGESVGTPEATGVAPFDSLPVATGPTTVTARDLLDGAPVPDLRLRARIGGAERALVANVSGQLGFPDGEIDSLVPDGETWRMPEQHALTIRESGIIWLYRTIAVSGRVEVASGSGPLNFTSVRLLQKVAGPPGFAPPITMRWLGVRGFQFRIRVPRPGIDGAFHARIAAIGEVAFLASARGFRDAVAMIPVARDSDRVRGVRIVLEAAPRIRGILRDTGGQPVARHEIRLCVLVDTGRPHRSVAWTGKDGFFEIAVPVEGRTSLFVPRLAGHRPLGREDIMVGRGGAKLDLTLTAVDEDPRVRFRYEGTVLAGRELIVSFRSGGWTTGSFVMALDAEGRAAAGLLEAGRDYAVRVRSEDWSAPEGRDRLLTWRGAEHKVELSKLRREAVE